MKPIVASIIAIGLTACSLAPAVRTSAIDYSLVIEQFTNQSLLRNILRARDRVPLNFADLPIVHGAIGLNAQLGLTVPFGPGAGANSAAPQLTFSSSPTFDTSALNTQGFTVGILQPISPVFISYFWNRGFAPELLFNLFVASIREGQTEESSVLNSLDDVEAYRKFKRIRQNIFMRNPQMKTVTMLVPFGPEIPAAVLSNGLKDYAGLDQSTFEVLASEDRRGYRIYKRINDQVVICVDPDTNQNSQQIFSDYYYNNTKSIDVSQLFFPTPFSAPTPFSGKPGRSGGPQASRPSVGSTTTPSSGKSVGAFSPSKSATTPSAASGVTVNAQTVHIPLVDRHVCDSSIVVINSPQTANDLREQWKSSMEISLRSTSAVIEYLGSIMRYLSISAHKEDEVDPLDETGCIIDKTPFNMRVEQKNPVYWCRLDGFTKKPIAETLFDIVQSPTPAGQIYVNYSGQTYSVPSWNTRSPDHTLQVISLLNDIINANKVASDIPVTRQVEVVP